MTASPGYTPAFPKLLPPLDCVVLVNNGEALGPNNKTKSDGATPNPAPSGPTSVAA